MLRSRTQPREAQTPKLRATELCTHTLYLARKSDGGNTLICVRAFATDGRLLILDHWDKRYIGGILGHTDEYEFEVYEGELVLSNE